MTIAHPIRMPLFGLVGIGMRRAYAGVFGTELLLEQALMRTPLSEPLATSYSPSRVVSLAIKHL